MSVPAPNPRYPYKWPLPEGVEWKNVTLFSIAGWCSQLLSGEKNAIAFGGYFKLLDDGSLYGEVIDIFGGATIEGTLTEDTLEFTKTYTQLALSVAGPVLPVNYRFHKEEGCWKGGYSIEFPPAEGESECEIAPVVEDAFGLISGPLEEATP